MAAPESAAPSAQRPSRGDNVVSVAETAVRFAAEGLSGCDVPGLEGAAKTALGIISHIKKVRDNTSARQDVEAEIRSLREVLRAATERVAAQMAQPIPVTQAEALPGPSIDISPRILALQSRLDAVNLSAKKLSKQRWLVRVIMASRNSDVLKSVAESIRRAQNEFMLSGQIAVELRLQDVATQVKAIEGRQEAESSANAERVKKKENERLKSALEQLPYEADASYTASVHARHGELLDGTRTAILDEIDAWLACKTDEQRNRPFFVLRGGAGTGKSTIAFEVARRAESAGQLGATFFFARSSARLSRAEAVFPTLAWQLINNLPPLEVTALPLVLRHLNHGAHQNVDRQAHELFKGLLERLPKDHPPILIVIDAVDECTESTQDLVCRMLYHMMGAVSDMPCPIRIFVTSRPEVHLEETFEDSRFSSAQKYVLHDIPRPIVDKDIRLYFSMRLSELSDPHRQMFLELYPDAPDDLTELAAGLFIYAATAFEFLKLCRGGMARGMDQLIKSRSDAAAPLDRLHLLYSLVLDSAFPDGPGAVPVPRSVVQKILGCIAVLQEHVSPQDLALLTGLDLHSEVLIVVQRLGAVLSFQDKRPDAPMQLLHASFAEYLVTPGRSTASGFYIDEGEHHGSLAIHCLSLLLRPHALVRNICRLPNPTILKVKVTDLTERIKDHLPAHMQYLCSHWLAHVAHSHGSPDVLPFLERFCISSPRVLEWLEALAFLDGLDRAVQLLPVLCGIYPPSHDTVTVGNILYDVFRIALDFSPAIRACPHQLYVSALPLVPAESRLRSIYFDILQAPNTLTSPASLLGSWVPWHDTGPSDSRGYSAMDIKFAQFAPHGRWLAVFGGRDTSILLCRPVTGDIIQSIRGHHTPVLHLHFSSNGLRMVSTSEKCILIHSTRSGTILRSLTVDGLASRAFLVSEDSAVLFQFRQKGDNRIALWKPSTDSTIFLDEMHPNLGRVSLSISDVSSTGRWVILVHKKITGYFAAVFTAMVMDLSFGLSFRSVASQFTQASGVACFVPGTETVVVPRANSLDLLDMITTDVLRTVPIDGANRQVVAILASPRSQNLVALVGATARPADSILVQPSEGTGRTLPASDLAHIALSPDGRYIVGVLRSGDAWRTIDLVGNLPTGSGSGSPTNGDHSLYTVGISDDLGSIAFSSNQNFGHYNMSSGAQCTIRTSQELRRIDGALSTPRRLSLTRDGCIACMVLKHHVAVFDVRNSGSQLLLGLTEARLRAFNETIVSGVSALEWDIESGDFSPEGARLFALVHVRISHGERGEAVWDAHHLACWDLNSSGDAEPMCRLFRLQEGLDGTVVRTRVTADGMLHFTVAPRQGGMYQTHVLRLPPDGDVDMEAGPLVAPETEEMPDDLFTLWGNWIHRSEGDETRPAFWIPPSRRPSGDRLEAAVATRGNLIALVSDSGLLTVLSVPAYVNESRE